MAVTFSSFDFNNTSGIDALVTLEAPIGTLSVSKQRVNGRGKHTFQINNMDVGSVMIFVEGADGDHSHDGRKSLDFTSFKSLISALSAEWYPGSIRGIANITLSLAFSD